MPRKHHVAGQLTALAAWLSERRETLLRAWRQAVEQDPVLAAAVDPLSRSQLNDHIPGILDAFEAMLRTRSDRKRPTPKAKAGKSTTGHGLLRWQMGYKLHEVTREWSHLHLCLLDALETYAADHPDLEPEVMPAARRVLSQLYAKGVSESTARYYELQQIEAAGQVRELEQSLAQLGELERSRAEVWREVAHDLRGSLNAVSNAATALSHEDVPEATRAKFIRLLQSSVSSQEALLNDVMSLARLQAGHEQRQVEPFDATALLGDLCMNTQPLARERHLFLKMGGPESLPVEGDPSKLQRITQNLVLNALKYTRKGGVTVTWGDSRENDPQHWMLCVQDTGPGLPSGPAGPLADALQEATEENLEIEESKDDVPAETVKTVPAHGAGPQPQPAPHQPGEGIGLSIVKRLCSLLDASLELESKADEGTVFRVILPRKYDA